MEREGKSGVGKLAGKMAVRDLHTVIKVIQAAHSSCTGVD